MEGGPLHVAVGVIINHDNKVLIALRDPHAHQGGLWEFPGGKVEARENVELALVRELYEELGLVAEEFKPLMEIIYDYPDKSVRLDVWWVQAFSGEPEGREGQPIKWVDVDQLTDFSFPEANQAIIEAIQAAV